MKEKYVLNITEHGISFPIVEKNTSIDTIFVGMRTFFMWLTIQNIAIWNQLYNEDKNNSKEWFIFDMNPSSKVWCH